jgi:ubiquinone/menaquinone biosynthesis C-methylase UbiE
MNLTANRFESAAAHSIESRIPEISTEIERLTPILFGAAAFQHLNAGCELGLFELLERTPRASKEAIGEALRLQPRATEILLLGTTALGLTHRVDGCYSNRPIISTLFRSGNWDAFKNVVAFEQHIVYEAQVDYCDSLRNNTNVGLRRVRGTGRDLYHRLAENPSLQGTFYRYMHSWSQLANERLLRHFPFASVRNLLDVGGGDGVNAINLARACPHLHATVFEIPGSAEIARRSVRDSGLDNRISIVQGDMFRDDYPAGHDCVAFIHQLVIWTPEENIQLLTRAYEALPTGGRTVIFSSISDDNGDGPLMAALDSVYFAALPAEGGMIYCWQQYEDWLRTAGFRSIQRVPCREWTPHGLIIATK